jgi:hypothetical protein
MNPVAKENLDALGVMLDALKAAEVAQKSVVQIAELLPDDKTVPRSKKDVEGMIVRFQKRAEAARKVIRAVASREMPPELMKLGKAAAKIVAARMVDPSKLRVIPWMGETWEKKISYSVILRIEAEDLHVGSKYGSNRLDVVLVDDGSRIHVRVDGCDLHVHGAERDVVVTPKIVAGDTFPYLVGWPGLKGEVEATEGRRQVAGEIARVMKTLSSKLGMRDWGGPFDEVEQSADLRKISTAYRSDNLPKEGERSVGEMRYSEMLREEFARARKAFEGALAAHKDQIEGIEIHDGEKSWIYITVTLK